MHLTVSIVCAYKTLAKTKNNMTQITFIHLEKSLFDELQCMSELDRLKELICFPVEYFKK